MALCHGAIMAHVKCSIRFPSFGRFDWVLGPFWAKKGCFGAQNAQFPPDLAPPPWGATGDFLAQNLDCAGAPLGV